MINVRFSKYILLLFWMDRPPALPPMLELTKSIVPCLVDLERHSYRPAFHLILSLTKHAIKLPSAPLRGMHILFLILTIMSSDAIGMLWVVSLQVEFEQPHMGSYAAYEDDDYRRLRVVSCCSTFLHTNSLCSVSQRTRNQIP